MGIAALITWLLTAAGGFVMLGIWIAKGGARQNSKFPPAVIFGHFGLAAAGLVIWIIYLIADSTGLAWTAFVIMVPVALLGFVMLARWIPTYRSRTAVPASAGGAGSTATAASTAPAGTAPAEKNFPVAIVAGHGLFAVVTVVLVLLTAVGVG
jgi:manganese efflux pump family protein